jgi:cbb3-type cytochrome oxidase subunit 3
VANNSLKEGETYIIKGVIDDEYAKNYMFGDSADTTSDGQEFTYTKGELSTTSGSNSDVIEIFGGISKKWLTIIAIILLVLCIIGILLWLLSTRRRHDAEDRFLTVGGNGSGSRGSGRGGSGSGGSGNGFQDDDGFYDDYIEPKG